MQVDRTVWVGAGIAGLLGLLIGYGIGASGGSDLETVLGRQDELKASVAALGESVGAVEARIGEIGGAVEGLATAQADRIGGVESRIAEFADAQSGRLEGVAQRLEGLGKDVSGGLSGIGSSVSQALSEDLSDLRAKVAALGARAAGETGATDAAAPAAPGEPVGIGQTAVFGGGAARVFLSSANEAEGRARVAINGATTSELRVGAPVEVGDCRVTLTGFGGGQAFVAGACGAAAPEGSGVGDPVAVGKSELFGDGAVRVFLSGVDVDAGPARVAINGPSTTTLTMSEPVTAGKCTVELTGIDGGAAILDVAC